MKLSTIATVAGIAVGAVATSLYVFSKATTAVDETTDTTTEVETEPTAETTAEA